MPDTLKAPWRMEYILDEKPDYCVFCKAIKEKDKKNENLILFEGKDSFVIMNRYPYSYAHILVLPQKHVSRLDKLSKSEQKDFFALVVTAQDALEKAIHPQGMNIGMNIGKIAGAGIEEHLHMHILPRWLGDHNFMPVLSSTSVMHEHLEETYKKLVKYFGHISSYK